MDHGQQYQHPETTAASIVSELQQRCEKLRDWHIEAEQRMGQERAALEAREQQAARQREENHNRSRELDERHLAQDHRERQLNDRSTQLDTRQHEIEAHEHRVHRLENEAREQLGELKDMRVELDEEWVAVNRLRRAQEALAEALDADRQRVNEMRFKLVSTDAQPQESQPRQAA